MSDEELEERGSRLEQAMFGSQTEDQSKASESKEPKGVEEIEETEEAKETERDESRSKDDSTLVEETHDLHMYLPESRYQELMSFYKILDGEYYREHGKDLEKNRGYFDAVIATALTHEDEIRERLLDE
ncbi:hypothetical protein ACFFQF_33445 [Haladaptatus pallidirubidus]|uniref:DUF8160 domain-containing protein n=1 Tax=Haladaptatus pallidirubidus TaxID=1008152 RepID=A0AAV3UPY3_9EURY|nr:hypothetical protein [Haladaptatus pallidirubidus]